MKKHLRIHRLDISKWNSTYMQKWNLSPISICELAEEEVIHEIRSYFVISLYLFVNYLIAYKNIL